MNATPSDPVRPARIAIVGLGPVGLILAVHLKEAGCQVAICDNDKIKINLIRKEGVRLEGALHQHESFDQVYAGIGELKDFDPDILFACMKGYQTPAFVEQLLPLKFDRTLFVSAQNGIDVEHIFSGGIGEGRSLRMVINFAGNLNAPNVVKVTFFNPPNYIASVDDSKAKAASEISEWLNSVNLTTQAVSSFELLKRIWEKAILNASLSALCGIGKLTIREAMEIPDTVEVIEQVIEEAIEVAEAEKIKFEDEFIRKCLRYLRKAGDHFPSLAVDLINNRPTEIDFINGKIVEYGRKHYIRTPLNLAFTNIVKAMSQKSASAFMKTMDTSLIGKKFSTDNSGRMETGVVVQGGDRQASYYLGIDLGSVYSKFTVIDREGKLVFKTAMKTLNRDRIGVRHVMQAVKAEFNIVASCATGYGRRTFPDADLVKTEINCAAAGVQVFLHGEKGILDIGGEDIKVIRCDYDGLVENFYLNDKCAAGTGAFLTEIAERAGIEITEMSKLAEQSEYKQELNSFCTVFAKTEIMKWIFDGQPIENLARGIYLSIVNRVSKMKMDTGVPLLMIGGVIAHHPYLKKLLEERLNQPVRVLENPQFMVAYGAAILAREFADSGKMKSEDQWPLQAPVKALRT